MNSYNEAYTRQIILSDKTLKSDIKSLDGDKSLKFISELEPKSFIFNKSKHIGFIAQQVEEINPHCVIGNLAKEKNNLENPLLSVSYTDIFVHNTNAVKYLIEYVELLYLKVNALEKKLDCLVENIAESIDESGSNSSGQNSEQSLGDYIDNENISTSISDKDKPL